MKNNYFFIENGILYSYTGNEKDVIIPNGTRTIAVGSFKDCDITSVTIPASVVVIQRNAFTGNPSLKDVYFRGTEEEFKNTIEDCNDALFKAKLHFMQFVDEKNNVSENDFTIYGEKPHPLIKSIFDELGVLPYDEFTMSNNAVYRITNNLTVEIEWKDGMFRPSTRGINHILNNANEIKVVSRYKDKCKGNRKGN